MLNCYDKNFTIIEIFALQMKIYVRKGCKVFAVYVMDDKDNDNKVK